MRIFQITKDHPLKFRGKTLKISEEKAISQVPPQDLKCLSASVLLLYLQ